MNTILILAHKNEIHKSKNKKVNKFWKEIRNYLFFKEFYTMKYGPCEICGKITLLRETGLNWSCNNPKCEKEIKK